MVTENRIKKYFYETKMSGFIDLFNVGNEEENRVKKDSFLFDQQCGWLYHSLRIGVEIEDRI